MIRYLVLLLATAQLLSAATGDVSIVARADGWSVDVYVEGFTTGATVNHGYSGAYNDLTPSVPYLTVSGPGYVGTTASTVGRVIYLANKVRKPYPDQTTTDWDTTTVPGSLRIRYALAEPLYADDDSLANVTLTCPPGWIVNTAGAGQSSNARSGAAVVTSNSTLAYPPAVSQWDWRTTKAFRRKTGDFDVGVRATHAFGIAAVKIDAVGATSGHTQTSTVTTVSKIGPCASGLYYDSYVATIPISGFTQGEQIDLRFRVYPNIGTNVTDSDGVSTLTQKGNGQIEVTCDKTGALAVYGVVKTAAQGGSDTTGATSSSIATARTTPYATVAEAINDNATIVVLTDDGTATHNFTQTPVKSQAYAIEIIPDPLDTAANITLDVTTGGSNTRCKNLALVGGYKVNFGASSNYFDGQTATYNSTFFADGVTWDSFWTSNMQPNVNRFGIAVFSDVNFLDYKLNVFGTTQFNWSAYGASFASDAGRTLNEWGAMVACKQTSDTMMTFTFGGASNPGHVGSNQMFEFCKFDRLSPTGTGDFLKWDDLSMTGDCSFRGNIVSARVLQDTNFFIYSTGTPCNNVLIRHQTWQGVPFASMYESSGSTTAYKTNVFYSGNAFMRMSCKSDTFSTPNGARVGNWWFVNGCGLHNNRIDGALFPLDWHGLNSGVVGGNSDTNYTEMGYTDDSSYFGSGAGQGDFKPTSGSILAGAMPVSKAHIAFDLFGTDIPSAGNMEIGAVLRASTVPPNTFPVVTITSPSTGASQASPVSFTGTATDTEDGTISSSIVWSSSVDGSLGTGASISAPLSSGAHVITATITDAGGAVDTDTINLTVTAPPAGGTLNATRVNAGTVTIQ